MTNSERDLVNLIERVRICEVLLSEQVRDEFGDWAYESEWNFSDEIVTYLRDLQGMLKDRLSKLQEYS